MDHSLTVIPPEVLNALVMVLLGIVWKDLKNTIAEVRLQSQRRNDQLIQLRLLVKQICTKLKIPNGWHDDDDNGT